LLDAQNWSAPEQSNRWKNEDHRQKGERQQEAWIVMNDILILLAVSSLLGFVLGFYFSWLATSLSGLVLAFLSAVVLQHEGFGSLAGIAVIVGCLTVNQIACLIGVLSMNRWSSGPVRQSPRRM